MALGQALIYAAADVKKPGQAGFFDWIAVQPWLTP
jgi:hypothetical protein